MPFDTIWRDVTYAARSLRRTPGFAVTTIVTLALGIGATSAIFSLVNAALRAPPTHSPVPSPPPPAKTARVAIATVLTVAIRSPAMISVTGRCRKLVPKSKCRKTLWM